MNRMYILMAVAASLVSLLSTSALAQDHDDKVWTVATELGVIATSGNTETTSVQGKIDAKQELTRWHNHYILSALFKEDQITEDDGSKTTEKTAERYFGSLKSAYQLESEHSNFFVFGSHAEDKFGSYEQYTTLAIGYGTRLYNRENMQLDAEIGPGYFRGERVMEDDVIQEETGMIIRGAASYAWQITNYAEFKQTLSIESGEDNTRTVAESSLSTRINDAMQMKVGFNVANDSDVAPDKKNTDTTTYINLVYNF